MIPRVSQNNGNSDELIDFNSDTDDKNDEDINKEVKATPQTTINTKVVQAMKKLQASYNNDANKIIKQATKEKGAIENLNFLINVAMVSNGIKPTMEEPQTFNKAWNHPS